VILVNRTPPSFDNGHPAGPALGAYLLGSVEFASALAVQQALATQVAHDREAAALILCEHPPAITVGRHGDPSHLRFDLDDLRVRGWPVRWVGRGGGCLLHLPGQLAVYPIFPLDRLGLGIEAYLGRLHEVILALLADFSVRGQRRPGRAGVWVGDRLLAAVGVAVRHWVSSFGVALNVNPDLVPFRQVQTGAPGDGPMTSLARERGGNLRKALIRQRLLEHFAEHFGFGRTSLFFHHPLLHRNERLTWEAEESVEVNGQR
jgi:lipoyl(octanoyl) transferase